MKNFLIAVLAVLIFALLMVLPGFVLYIVGDIANRVIPDAVQRRKHDR